ncbi:TPA: hypothetical protein ACKP89_000994 [Stenotrophomonas maltophilia]|jgi:hypothetical protein|uniref:hypothetical protein n=1 Tax=Stenotrophomonas maltophilia TaxID=40324 RepID=UPI000C148A03|nr:hypothetical protein [Stenotrophomonas maltophilia]EKT4096900.1 hypothetical protein [Stenotrophomonas maltophilia]MBA0235101.1 hypothetical protein [Stenotrophomonas maltophilia]MBA0268234.1 hypothetical protein [Stenotrophomonas maltophilia]MBA0333116.1 hypothetical protein [Stenotrophomonas maltophilia]MBH1581566.1 hypothetical protein [Stenotrophomonas maltophilia]
MRKVSTAVLLSAVVLGFVYGYFRFMQSDELGAKYENSLLQAMNARYENSEHTKSLIAERMADGTDSDVIGLPRAGVARGYVWFIANPKSVPLVKKMPADLNYRLSEAQIEEIALRVRLDPAIRGYLLENRQ